jgi:ABC-type multidrug transport system fused ATPase/permease subunit
LRELAVLYRFLDRARRRQLLVTLALMLVGAAAEMVTVGAVLPFLAFLADPASVLVPPGVAAVLERVGGSTIAGAALLLIAAATLAAAARLYLSWQSQRFVMHVGIDIACAVFARRLRLPYDEQVRRNSSTTLTDVEQVQRIVNAMLYPAMQAASAAVIALFVGALLFVIDAFAAGIGAAAAVLIYAGFSLITRPPLHRYSHDLSVSARERTRMIQEALSGIRDIILDRSESRIETRFRETDTRYRRALAVTNFIAGSARYPIEAAGIAALALIALAMSLRPGGLNEAIPVLGALALGAQRLLPLLQTIYVGWSQIAANRRSFRDVMEAASLAVPERAEEEERPQPLGRFDELAFAAVGYRHHGARFSVHDLSFTIGRGEHLGIAGPTGSGKSTLLDLVMGLLEPQAGEIRLNGRPLTPETLPHWQASIAHVPQTIFLADDSLAANIAFPRPAAELDPERLEEAVRAASLAPFLATLPEGIETRVGERGMRLSGGQRQRIGIARALARRPLVIILDEATSALDDTTEEEVLAAIEAIGGLTIVTVAHRASTLARCDRVLTLKNGRIVAVAPAANSDRRLER